MGEDRSVVDRTAGRQARAVNISRLSFGRNTTTAAGKAGEIGASTADISGPASPSSRELRARLWPRPQRALRLTLGALALVIIGTVIWLWLAGDPEDASQVARVKLDSTRPDPSELLRPGDDDDDSFYYSDLAAETLDAPGIEEGGIPEDVNFESRPDIDGPSEEPPPVRIVRASRPELIAQGPHGPLPIIGKNGVKPKDAYARPFKAPTSPPGGYVAILIGGMGLSGAATRNALDKLPADVSLSFAPYGNELDGWAAKARGKGHEIGLELPLEPFNYPENDPGPYTLLTTSAAQENLDRLNWLLSRMTDYAFVTNYQGAKFTTTPEAMKPLFEAVAGRGLAFVDNGGSRRTVTAALAPKSKLPAVVGDKLIDGRRSAEDIDAALAELETLARQNGFALGIGTAFPLTVQQVQAWSQTLAQKNLKLAPVSALLRLKARDAETDG